MNSVTKAMAIKREIAILQSRVRDAELSFDNRLKMLERITYLERQYSKVPARTLAEVANTEHRRIVHFQQKPDDTDELRKEFDLSYGHLAHTLEHLHAAAGGR